eukprot:763909_1
MPTTTHLVKLKVAGGAGKREIARFLVSPEKFGARLAGIEPALVEVTAKELEDAKRAVAKLIRQYRDAVYNSDLQKADPVLLPLVSWLMDKKPANYKQMVEDLHTAQNDAYARFGKAPPKVTKRPGLKAVQRQIPK